MSQGWLLPRYSEPSKDGGSLNATPPQRASPPPPIAGEKKKQGTDKDWVQRWLHLEALYFAGFKSGVAYHLPTDEEEQTFRLKPCSPAPISGSILQVQPDQCNYSVQRNCLCHSIQRQRWARVGRGKEGRGRTIDFFKSRRCSLPGCDLSLSNK